LRFLYIKKLFLSNFFIIDFIGIFAKIKRILEVKKGF